MGLELVTNRLRKATAAVIGVIFLMAAALFARKMASQDNTGMPTRVQLLAEIQPFLSALDGPKPHYFNRSSLVGVTIRSEREVPKTLFFETADRNGWVKVRTQSGAYFREDFFCKGRLSLTSEQGPRPESYYVISVRWSSDPISPAYCKSKTAPTALHD